MFEADSFDFFFKVEGRLWLILVDLLGLRCCKCCFSRPVEAEVENFVFGEAEDEEEDEEHDTAAGVVQPPFLKSRGRLSVVEAIETIDVEAVASPPPPLPFPPGGGGGKAKD